jgi:5-methyltetrahydropteroyltriglutamate--homocysteine methyltransferase
MRVDQFVLEYATPRAGDVEVVGRALADREIGLGVVNPRTAEPEPVEEIVAKAERALAFYRPEQVFLNPDCGFGCFANRCVNEEEVAVEKLRRIAAAARELRERHG